MKKFAALRIAPLTANKEKPYEAEATISRAIVSQRSRPILNPDEVSSGRVELNEQVHIRIEAGQSAENNFDFPPRSAKPSYVV